MKKALLLIVSLSFMGFSLNAATIAKDSMQEKSGSTRSKGSYHIYDDGSNVKVSVAFNVRKSGMTGTGKGVIAFQILNDSWEPVLEFKKGLTVGAKAPQGTNDKDWKKTITLTGPKAKKVKEEGLVVAFMVDTERDDIGIPQSIDDWKKAIKDVADLKKAIEGLGEGSSSKKGAWKFFKLKAGS